MFPKKYSKRGFILFLLLWGSLIFFLFGIKAVVYAENLNKGLVTDAEVAKARKTLITPTTLDQMDKLPGGIKQLPPVLIPPDNPQTDAKVMLGKMLFFDKRLSQDSNTSCASCHDPRKGFSDARARAIGFGGEELGRHSPTIMNAAYNHTQFWDGRSPTLEDQAQKPIQSKVEMNLSPDELAKRLNNVPEYKKEFQAIFKAEPNIVDVGKAIAAFERTIVTPESRFDQYMAGDKNILTLQEKKGLILFVSKAACSQCHNGPNFTDDQFHVLGVPQKGPRKEDLGRFEFTKDEKDKMAFKTPSLRNVALIAPYMHDGAFETLEEVVDFYNQGGGSVPFKSPKILKLHLTDQEKKDLVAFLKTLTGKVPVVLEPQLPKENGVQNFPRRMQGMKGDF